MGVQYIGELLDAGLKQAVHRTDLSEVPGAPPIGSDTRAKLLDAADSESGPWFTKSCHPDFMSPQAIERRRKFYA